MTRTLHRRAALTCGLALALGPAARAAPSLAEPGVHDLTPEFWRFYDAGAGDEIEGRARDLQARFFQPNGAAYAAAGFGRDLGPLDPARLSGWLPEFDPLAPAARRASQMAPDAWRGHERRFAQHFGAYRTGAAAYVLLSLFAFDLLSGARGGRRLVFLGVDGLVRAGGEAPDLAVLLDRTDFRSLHRQVNPGLWPAAAPVPLWMALWREGLSTYVAARLNPDASTAEALGSGELAAEPPAALAPLAAQALAALETTDPAEDRRFLQPGFQGDMPARSGYLLGLRLAERAGRSLSLDQLARLPAAKVRRFARQELSQFAHG